MLLQAPLPPESIASKFWLAVATFLVGALVTHIWTRFRSRLATLSWTATSARWAVSAADTGYGAVQVLYENQPVNNLHVVTIILRNESTRDLVDLPITFAFLEGTLILISEGSVVGNIRPLAVDQAFMGAWREAVSADPLSPQVRYFQTRRDYAIPVFNRGSVARFDALVTRPIDNNNPLVNVEISHAGVQVKNRAPATELLGVPQTRAQIYGIILAAVVTYAAVKYLRAPGAIGATSLMVGLMASVIGALAIRLVQALTRALS